jgi:hypothetical protein
MPDVTQPLGDNGQPAQFAPIGDWANAQAVAYTGSAAQSAAITAVAVIITGTTDCWYTIGSNPTAVAAGAGSDFLPAGVKWGVMIFSGQKISVVQSSSAGTLAIIPAKTL